MQQISNSVFCNIGHLVKFSGVRQKWWKLMEILSVSSSLNTSGGARPNTFESGAGGSMWSGEAWRGRKSKKREERSLAWSSELQSVRGQSSSFLPLLCFLSWLLYHFASIVGMLDLYPRKPPISFLQWHSRFVFPTFNSTLSIASWFEGCF